MATVPRLWSFLLFLATALTLARHGLAHRLLLHETPSPSSSPVGPSYCIRPHTVAEAMQQPFCTVPPSASRPAHIFQRAPRGVLALAGQTGTYTPEQVDQQRARWSASYAAALVGSSVSNYIQQRQNITLGGVPAVIATPVGAASTQTVMFWLHGGAFFWGSCYTNQLMTVAGIARSAGMAIVCPEYRLSPEHPFPAGLDDALAAYQALVQQYSPAKVALIGDSAGGGMAMALLQRLHKQGLPMPAAVGLLSPWVDLSAKGDTLTTLNGADLVLASDGTPGPHALAYVGNDASKLQDPLVSPLYADYSPAAIGQLPPMLIQVGLREVLLSDSVNLYRALVRAGQTVNISPWEGMWHIFHTFQAVPEAQEASKEMAAFLNRAITG